MPDPEYRSWLVRSWEYRSASAFYSFSGPTLKPLLERSATHCSVPSVRASVTTLVM